MLRPEIWAAEGGILGITVTGEVPFAKEAGRVAGFLQALGECDRLEGQHMLRGRRLHGAILRPKGRAILAVLGDVKTGRGQSGNQCPARGRADRCGRVGLGKADALFGQCIEARRVEAFVALASEIHPTEVVYQNKHDMRRSGEHGGGERHRPAGAPAQRQNNAGIGMHN